MAFKIVLPGAGIVDKDFGSAVVEVILDDTRWFTVTFRTLGNLSRTFTENRRTGARARGIYIPGGRTIVVEEITKAGIQAAIRDLLETGEFEHTVAALGTFEEVADDGELTDPRGVIPPGVGVLAAAAPSWRAGTLTAHSPRNAQTDQPLRIVHSDLALLVEKHLADWSTTLSIAGANQTLMLCFSEGKVVVVLKDEDGRNFTWLSLKESRESTWFGLSGQLIEVPERHLVSDFDAVALAEEFVDASSIPVADHEWEFRPVLPPRKARRG